MLNRKMLLSIVTATLLLSAAVADAFGDEMSWEVKQNSASKKHMTCKLSGGSTLKRGLDFVETKKLVCWEGTDLAVAQTVSCGPEGSQALYRRGKERVLVTCKTEWYAKK